MKSDEKCKNNPFPILLNRFLSFVSNGISDVMVSESWSTHMLSLLIKYVVASDQIYDKSVTPRSISETRCNIYYLRSWQIEESFFLPISKILNHLSIFIPIKIIQLWNDITVSQMKFTYLIYFFANNSKKSVVYPKTPGMMNDMIFDDYIWIFSTKLLKSNIMQANYIDSKEW